MTDEPSQRTYRDAMREALRALSPGELPYLDPAWEAYAANPGELDGPARRDHPLGSGIPVDLVIAWTPLVVHFVGEILAKMAVEQATRGIGRRGKATFLRWRIRRRRSREVDRPLPTFTGRQLEEIALRARETAAMFGHSRAGQDFFAEKMVEALTSHPETRTDASSDAPATTNSPAPTGGRPDRQDPTRPEPAAEEEPSPAVRDARDAPPTPDDRAIP